MNIPTSIIVCENQQETKTCLEYLKDIGYGDSVPRFVRYADEDTTWHNVVIHDNGRFVNTKGSVSDAKRDPAKLVSLKVFPSFYSFLISNRNVRMDGTPMAHEFTTQDVVVNDDYVYDPRHDSDPDADDSYLSDDDLPLNGTDRISDRPSGGSETLGAEPW